jgi:hypothetical protein
MEIGIVVETNYICELYIRNNHMFSSRISNNEILFSMFRDQRTVFRLKDVALLTGETSFQSLNAKLNYYVKTNRLVNPRRRIYAKLGYDPEELACLIYTPCYISLEYVLQRSGVIFQYDEGITAISYLSRSIEVDDRTYMFRKIKGEVLVNMAGIQRRDNHVNMATAERAFLDHIYLNKESYVDNLHPLNNKAVYKLLPVYGSNALTERVKRILQDA